LNIRNFIADISEENWRQTHIKSSPSRKLSDLFWLQLPWKLIKSELGPIRVFDTGCGSGNYGVKLQSYSKGGIVSYTGIDVSQHDNWEVLMKKYVSFRFCRLDSADILDHVPDGTNFFISQSAIEHFEEDLLYFEQIREFIRSTSRSIIQVHLFPSRACLRLYRLHGVRQYTPRTISLISRLFKAFSYSTLYRLGGKECNLLHWEFITKPLLQRTIDLRDIQTQEYDRRLRQAIATDNNSSPREPSFYALVIHSNGKNLAFVNAVNPALEPTALRSARAAA